jgi:hypothetical protein
MYIQKKGNVTDKNDTSAKPYYFFNGVLLLSKEAYDKIMFMANSRVGWLHDTSLNFAAHISKYSQFPVTHLSYEGTALSDAWRYVWYFNEKKYNQTFTPKWSGRNYKIQEGLLTEITSSIKKDQTLLREEAVQAQLPLAQGASQNSGATSQSATGSASSSSRSSSAVVKKDDAVSNCKTGSCSTNEPGSEGDEEPLFFDIIFQSDTEILQRISSAEMHAIRDFVKYYYKEVYEFDMEDDEVTFEVLRGFREAVTKNITIRECIQDNGQLNIFYLRALRVQADKMVDEAMTRADIAQDPVSDEDTTASSLFPVVDADEDADDLPPIDASFDYATSAQEAFEEDNKKEQEMAKVEEALVFVADAVDTTEELVRTADELQTNDCDFAQDAANLIYRQTTNIKHGLAELAEKHGQSELKVKINNLTV